MNELKVLQSLKNSVLSLAMQGKLVKQDDKDEPAIKLLEKIKNEKDELLKQGKLKKEKPLTPISEDEIPYELPKSWQWVRLGEVCDVINGDRSNKYPSDSDIKHEGVPFINAKNIINGEISLNTIKSFITSEKFKKLNSGKLKNNDIVFVLRGSVGKHGVFHVSDKYSTGFINAQLVILRPLSVNVIYMNLLFDTKYFIDLLEDKSTGSTVKQMSENVLSNLIFPLPPLAEQERIVAKIEEIFALIEETEKNINENKKLSKVLYNKFLSLAMQGKLVKQDDNDEPAIKLLEKIKNEKEELLKQGKLKKEKSLPPISEDEIPYELPKSWQWVRLGEVIQIISGTSYNKTDITVGNGIRILRGGNIQNNTILFNQDDIYVLDKYININKQIRYGDIVIVASTGSETLLGKAGFVEQLPNGNVQIGAFLRILRTNPLLISYLKIIFSSNYYMGYIRQTSQGVNINNIKNDIINNFLIPLPPLAEQERIVAKIEEIKEIIDKLG